MFFDIYYLVLVVPAILISLFVQIRMKSTFAAYSRVLSRSNISGKEAAALLMRANNITRVAIQPVRGSLTDHYDPGAKVLRLSDTVYSKTSLA
ncbi:MAG: zinc metallopeptidase, partial [Spirochaetaceae bacterium]|nr:zinc metallopeptidase [Spirochaetaceae bacterium]